MPTYVLLSKQISVKAVSGGAGQETEAEYQALTQELAKATALASQLRIADTAVMPSHIVASIEKARSGEVTLGTIDIKEGDKKTKEEVLVMGVAKTRNDLRSFLDALKRDPYFLDAQVPVSDLAHDVDLKFTATLTIRTP
jgi:hypothetical protein